MIELTLLTLLNRLMNWGLAPLIAARTVAADTAALHPFLSDPANQVRLLGDRVIANQVRLLGDHPRGFAARVRPTASRRVISAELLRGKRTVLRATWILSPSRGTTDVDLAVQFETRGLATRVALALGGRRWLARRADTALARLAQICARAAEEAVPVPASISAPAAADCARRARSTRLGRDARRAHAGPRTGRKVA
jgi:hypothetical protein